jgi:hypothetical protein
MLYPSADSLNWSYPDIREDLARTLIETQISLMGIAICQIEESGVKGLLLQAFDLDENLSQIKVTLLPEVGKSKFKRTWFGENPLDFYSCIYIEELPKLSDSTTESKLDELFFTVFNIHEKGSEEILALVISKLQSDFGLTVSFSPVN